jgi:hypothetical protein
MSAKYVLHKKIPKSKAHKVNFYSSFSTYLILDQNWYYL